MQESTECHVEMLVGFVEESTGALRSLPAQLADYQERPQQVEPLNAVFRALHSIKGTAGFFGWVDVRDFAHGLENALDDLRSQQSDLPDDLRQALVRGFDRLESLLDGALAGRSTTELANARQRELQQLAALSRRGAPAPSSHGPSWEDICNLAKDVAALPAPGAVDLAQRLLWLAREERPSSHGDAAAPFDTAAPPSKPAPQANPQLEAAPRWLRIREERLDHFLKLASQMFAVGAEWQDVATRLNEDPRTVPLAETLHRTNRRFHEQAVEMQEGLVALRKTTLAPMFGKYPRVARELAAHLGKQVEATICGAQTEVDKSLVDDLDAIVGHLVRNSIDHGLESPAERLRAGKPPVGRLIVRGGLARSLLTIAVEDDGRGIDPQRLRTRTIEAGWLSPQQAADLTDDDALDFIFQSGFSTAGAVTEISGRGVGMDAVRAAAAKYGGRVHVNSVVGQGTTITTEIPVRGPIVEP